MFCQTLNWGDITKPTYVHTSVRNKHWHFFMWSISIGANQRILALYGFPSGRCIKSLRPKLQRNLNKYTQTEGRQNILAKKRQTRLSDTSHISLKTYY